MNNRYWIIIPAAGIGQRFRSDLPKQYEPIQDKPILQHSIELFSDLKGVQQVVVVLHPSDQHFKNLSIQDAKIKTVVGAAERYLSVLNALNYLKQNGAQAQDWVLIHDAVRPCLHPLDLKNMLTQLKDHPVGGILAQRQSDTVKEVEAMQVIRTLLRDKIWCALTPQLFRFNILLNSIQSACEKGIILTDDCAFVELAGFKPQIVEANYPNPKLTYPADLDYLNYLLCARQEYAL